MIRRKLGSWNRILLSLVLFSDILPSNYGLEVIIDFNQHHRHDASNFLFDNKQQTIESDLSWNIQLQNGIPACNYIQTDHGEMIDDLGPHTHSYFLSLANNTTDSIQSRSSITEPSSIWNVENIICGDDDGLDNQDLLLRLYTLNHVEGSLSTESTCTLSLLFNEQRSCKNDESWTVKIPFESAEYGSLIVVTLGKLDHKHLWPLNRRDIVGFCLLSLGVALAAGAGVGAGEILVPLYTLVLGFDAKHAIPLSKITAFGGAIANVILLWNRKHPTVPHRHLIDWDIVLLMEPMTMAGALIGTMINKIVSYVVIVSILLPLLFIISISTFQKAVQKYKKESSQAQDQAQEQVQDEQFLEYEQEESPPNFIEIHDEDGTSKAGPKTPPAKNSKKPEGDTQVDKKKSANLTEQAPQYGEDEGSPSFSSLTDLREPGNPFSLKELLLPQQESEDDPLHLSAILESERQHPKYKISALFILFCIVSILNVLKGGWEGTNFAGIRCGSVTFYVLIAVTFVVLVLFTILCRHVLMKETAQKIALNYPFAECDIQWDQYTTLLYPGLCIGIGVLAGLVGVAGGIMKGPLLLSLGVDPLVTAASSAVMVLFTSATTSVSFLTFGMVVYDYAAVLIIISFISSFFGQLVMTYLVKKSGRSSYVAFVIGIVTLAGGVALLVTLLKERDAMNNDRGICTSSREQ